MIYKIQHGSVEYGAETILSDIDFEIKNKNEKIAVVGRNGCGKTTLLKLIAGDISLSRHDGDENTAIIKTGNPEIGYLRQIAFENEDLTLDEEIRKVFDKILSMKKRLDELVFLMSENKGKDGHELSIEEHESLAHEYTELEEKFKDDGGYYYEKEYDTMLRKFGFSNDERNKKLNEFSGGQRTKLAFIKLLLSKPDILLLDEPTNHLDITTIEWLEGYIKGYPKAVVIVSHDRMFLDNTVETVYEIEHTKARRYPGNYTYFVNRKKEDYEQQMKAYNAQQKEIERLEKVAERFMAKATKTSMAQSKLKAIEHMEKIEAPDRYDNRTFHATFEPAVETGKDVLFVNDLKVGYDKILATVNLDIKRGQRVAVIGGNGIGKSTLLKTLVGVIEPIYGEYRYGTNVQVGYFDQQMAEYSSHKQVIDDFWDEYPNLTETEVRNCLGAFLFTGEDVFKTVDMLSGGERVRLALCKIFKNKPNVLILDEPTNHMDIVGKETLESMLKDFAGTVIFVSHDRYFVKKVSDVILEMRDDGCTLWQFGYDDYVEKTTAIKEGTTAAYTSYGTDNKMVGGKKATDTMMSSSEPTAAQSSYQAGKEQSRNRKKIQKIEEEIERLESIGEELKTKLSDPSIASSYMKLSEVQAEIDANEEKLLELMDEWETLNEG
ncbi:MAG: ABC-F type ribosomal protection protein [Lachnospiraceae bacterium]|nr:ABC-F type ribosomal protection protein [Lachnospiraceae bacterium]